MLRRSTMAPPGLFTVSKATEVLLTVDKDVANTKTYLQNVALRIEKLEADLAQRFNDSELTEEIRLLKSAHNAATPIGRLPPELLCDVFWYLPAAYPGMIEITMGPQTHNWVSATQVCRLWREIAIGCPSLWGRLDFTRPQFLDTMLARSQDAPLYISFNGVADLGKAVTKPLENAMSQTKRLRVVDLERWYGDSTWATFFDAWEDQTLHILEVLRIEGIHNPPDGLCQVHAPCLRELSFVACGVHWDCLPLGAALTHLDLSEEIELDGHRPSLPAFVASLKATPALQAISLTGFLPLCDEGAFYDDSLSPVSLPQLRSVVLDDLSLDMRLPNFFRVVDLPGTVASIEVTFDEVELDGEVVEYLVANIRRSVPTSTYRSWRNHETGLMTTRLLKICEVSVPGDPVSLKLWFNGDAPQGEDYDLLGLPSITLILHGDTPPVDQALVSFNRHFNLSPLQVICFCNGRSLEATSLESWDMIASLPNVSFLSLVQTANATLLDALDAIRNPASHPMINDHPIMPENKDDRDPVLAPPSFPALRYITLLDVQMRNLEGSCRETMDLLIETLREKSGIEHLRLETDSDLPGRYVKRLMRELPHVKVTFTGVGFEDENFDDEEEDG